MSLWEQYLDDKVFKKLDNDIVVDTLIIGGGITGISTLYHLRNQNDIALIEGNKIGNGVTKNTTGKITYLQGDLLYKIIKSSRKKAKEYLLSQIDAISILKEIIENEKINCDFQKSNSYLISSKEKDNKKLDTIKTFLEEENIKVNNGYYENDYYIEVENTYVFNPIKFLNSLKNILKNKNIYENTMIINIKKENDYYRCLTKDSKKIKAKKLILTCHYPFFLFPFLFPLMCYIEKSYISASEIPLDENYNYITYSKPIKSLRFYEDENTKKSYAIRLGSSHSITFHQNDLKNFKKVQNIFNISNKSITNKWTNIDIMTSDNIPFIGKIKDNLFLATGFNTWGMTNGILSGYITENLLLNNKSKYEKLFSPARISKIKKIPLFILNNVVSFISTYKKNKSWYKGNIVFTKKEGRNIAIFTDQNNKKHIVYNRCPHLKCKLVFNEIDKTWDCPCHSSRFDIDGKVINGPSTFDISYKE